jgi:hypothetical protein
MGQQAGKIPQLITAVLKINKALDLLRDDCERGFRIDIEPDSTIVADEQQDRADRIEFVTAMEKFMQTSQQIAMVSPQAVPLLGKFMQFSARGFRIGRDLESSIEEFCERMEEAAKASAAKPPPPNPEALKAQGEIRKQQVDLQKSQLESQSDQRTAAIEAQSAQVRAAAEVKQSQADIRQRELELQIEEMRARIEQMRVVADAHKISMDHQRNMMQPMQEKFEPRYSARAR